MYVMDEERDCEMMYEEALDMFFPNEEDKEYALECLKGKY